MVKKRMAECTLQSAQHMKKVQMDSLGSSLLSNLFMDKNGHKRSITTDSEGLVQASQTWYSVKNLNKKSLLVSLKWLNTT